MKINKKIGKIDKKIIFETADVEEEYKNEVSDLNISEGSGD